MVVLAVGEVEGKDEIIKVSYLLFILDSQHWGLFVLLLNCSFLMLLVQ